MFARIVKTPALVFAMLLACGRNVSGSETTRIDWGAAASNCEVCYHSGSATYAVTFDNIGTARTLDGATLIHDGLTIHPPKSTCSELIRFAVR